MASEVASKRRDDGDKYRCALCNLSYSSEKDLAEHSWSLIHHSEMEKQSAKSLPHSCSLCLVTMPSIKEYRLHLNNEKHKRAVERSRSGEDQQEKIPVEKKKSGSSKSWKKKKSTGFEDRGSHPDQRHPHSQQFPPNAPIPPFSPHFPPPGFGGGSGYQSDGCFRGSMHSGFSENPNHHRPFAGPPGFCNGNLNTAWQGNPFGNRVEERPFYSLENDHWNDVDWERRAREWRSHKEQGQYSGSPDWNQDYGEADYRGEGFRNGYCEESEFLSQGYGWDFSRSYPGTMGRNRRRSDFGVEDPQGWDDNGEDAYDIGPRKRQRDYDDEISSSKSYKMADSSTDFRKSVSFRPVGRMSESVGASSSTKSHAVTSAFQSRGGSLSGSGQKTTGSSKTRLTAARSTESLITGGKRGAMSTASENPNLTRNLGTLSSVDRPSSVSQKHSSAQAIKQKYLGSKASSKTSSAPKNSKSKTLRSPRDQSDTSTETQDSGIVDEAARMVSTLREQRRQANVQQREKNRKQALTSELDQRMEALASTRKSRISGALDKTGATSTRLDLSAIRPHQPSRTKSPIASLRISQSSVSSTSASASTSTQPQVRQGDHRSALSGSESMENFLDNSDRALTGNRLSDIERIRRSIEGSVNRTNSEVPPADSVDSSESSPLGNLPSGSSRQRSGGLLSRDLLLKMVNSPRSRKEQLQIARLKKSMPCQLRLPASRLSTLDDTEMVPDFTMGDLEVEDDGEANPIECDDLPAELQMEISQLLRMEGRQRQQDVEEGLSSRMAPADSSSIPSPSRTGTAPLQLADLANSLGMPQSSTSLDPEPSSSSAVRNARPPSAPRPSEVCSSPDTASVRPDSAAASPPGPTMRDSCVGASPPRPPLQSRTGLSFIDTPLQSAGGFLGSSRQPGAGSGLEPLQPFSSDGGARVSPGNFGLPHLGADITRLGARGCGTPGSGEGGGAGMWGGGVPQGGGVPHQGAEGGSSCSSVLGEGSVLDQVLAVSEREEELQAEVERAEARMRTLIGALQQTVSYHNRLVLSQRNLQRERLSLLRASDSQRSSQTSSSAAVDPERQRLWHNVPESGREATSSQTGTRLVAPRTPGDRTQEDLTLEDLSTAGSEFPPREEMARPSSTSLLMAPPPPPSPAPPPAPSPMSMERGEDRVQDLCVKQEPCSPPRACSSPGPRPGTTDTTAARTATLESASRRRESSDQELWSEQSRPQPAASHPYSVLLNPGGAGFTSPMAMLDSNAQYLGSITPFDDIRSQLHSHLSKLQPGTVVNEAEIKQEIHSLLHNGSLPPNPAAMEVVRQNSESTSVSVPTDVEGQTGGSHVDRATPRGSDCSLGERIRKMCQASDQPGVYGSDSDRTLVRDNSFDVDESFHSSRGLRACSVILEKLQVEPSARMFVGSAETAEAGRSRDAGEVREGVDSQLPDQTNSYPMSPGQRRRLSRKERDRLSRRRKRLVQLTTSEESSVEEGCGSPTSPRLRLQFQSRSPLSDSGDEALRDNRPAGAGDYQSLAESDARAGRNSAGLVRPDADRLGPQQSHVEEKKLVKSDFLPTTSTSRLNSLGPTSSTEPAEEGYVVQGTMPSGIVSFSGPKARVTCTLIHDGDLYVCYYGIQKPCRFQIEKATRKLQYDCRSLSMQCMTIALPQNSEDRLYVGGESRHLLSFHLHNPSHIREEILGGRITCLHESRGFLYAGLDTGFIEVIDLKTDKKGEAFRCSEAALSCIQSGQEGGSQLLCVGSQDSTIAILDAHSGLLVRTLTGHSKTPLAMQVMNHQVYSGGMDRLVMVHNLHNGNLEKSYVNSQGVIKAVIVEDDMLYTGGFDGLVRCYKDGKLVQMYYGAERAGILAISIHKGMLFTGNSAGVVESIPLRFSDRWACQCSSCDYVFGFREHLKFHIFRDHILLKARLMRCPWRECLVWITAEDGAPAVSIAQKVDEHMTMHLDSCQSS